jgi:hypothetical protein
MMSKFIVISLSSVALRFANQPDFFEDARPAITSAPRVDDGYVNFKLVLYNRKARNAPEVFLIDPKAMTPEVQRRVRFVLDHFRIGHRTESGSLLVPQRTWDDKNLMAEVTRKAMDRDWLLQVGKCPAQDLAAAHL